MRPKEVISRGYNKTSHKMQLLHFNLHKVTLFYPTSHHHLAQLTVLVSRLTIARVLPLRSHTTFIHTAINWFVQPDNSGQFSGHANVAITNHSLRCNSTITIAFNAFRVSSRAFVTDIVNWDLIPTRPDALLCGRKAFRQHTVVHMYVIISNHIWQSCTTLAAVVKGMTQLPMLDTTRKYLPKAVKRLVASMRQKFAAGKQHAMHQLAVILCVNFNGVCQVWTLLHRNTFFYIVTAICISYRPHLKCKFCFKLWTNWKNSHLTVLYPVLYLYLLNI